MILVWVLALLGSIAGGFTLLSVFAQSGAPQQAAAAALAVGLAVIPYCFARAIDELARANRRERATAGRPPAAGADDLRYG
jgi:hypothetical protein